MMKGGWVSHSVPQQISNNSNGEGANICYLHHLTFQLKSTEFGVDLSISELLKYHQVFQVLHISTLSDIADASGRIIRESAWSCAMRCKSEYTWPEKSIALSQEHKQVWH
mmetsp:Transcript_549/g.914  ORF Transcript_549/g.914 Transcript_549/m.914 type:complete len:110 (+) Transcript_549:176-505(+)